MEEALDFEEPNAEMAKHLWQRSIYLENLYQQLLKALKRRMGEK